MAVAVPASVAALLLVPADALFEQLVWFPVVGTQLYRALSLDVIGSPPAEVLGIVAFSWVPRAAILVTGVLIATGRRPGLGALAVFAALCQLQTLGRADLPHIAQAATPALLLTAAWFPAYPRHRWLWSGGLAGLLAAQALFVVLSLVWLVVPAQQHERDLGRGVQRILAVTGRNDPIFVGLTDNRYTHANPLIVYYLADRKPGTRLTMYNPGITNTEPHQRSMVRDLIRSGTSLAVLDSSFALLCEPENLSCRAGSRILDDFLETTFTNRERLGDVIVASSP